MISSSIFHLEQVQVVIHIGAGALADTTYGFSSRLDTRHGYKHDWEIIKCVVRTTGGHQDDCTIQWLRGNKFCYELWSFCYREKRKIKEKKLFRVEEH